MSESTQQHRDAAAGESVGCAVLTISDSRTLETDKGGPLIIEHLQRMGHLVVDRQICPDDPDRIGAQLDRWLGDHLVQAILTTGGTGMARRDTTIEVVERRLTVPLEGFGELFRMLSWEQVQAAAMLSRATAGLVVRDEACGGDTLVFAMPGSSNAVETAMSNLIAPELGHLYWERRR